MRSRRRLRPVSEYPRYGTSGGGRQRGSNSRPARRKRTDKAIGSANEQVLEQPPELEGDESLEFTWDFKQHVGDEDEKYQIILVGEIEVWRELAFWDNMVRFNEIKALLKQRYGTRFKSLTPTDGSLDYLTGDHYFRLKTLSWTYRFRMPSR